MESPLPATAIEGSAEAHELAAAMGVPKKQVFVSAPATPAALDAWIEARLSGLRSLQSQVRQNDEAAKRRIDMVLNWCEAENAKLQRRMEFLRGELLLQARVYPYVHGKKSKRFASGTIGSREQRERLIITEADDALQWVIRQNNPDLLENATKHTLRGVTSLKQWYDSTGEIPDGCEVVPKDEVYYVTPDQDE